MEGEQFVHHHAERVDVEGRRRGLEASSDDLRRHVRQRTELGRRFREFLLSILQPGQPEVEESRPAVLAQDDVGRLDVAVQDAVVVRVDQGLRHLTQDLEAADHPVVGRVGTGLGRGCAGVFRIAAIRDGLKDIEHSQAGRVAAAQVGNHPGERLTLHVVHAEERDPILLADAVDRDDPRVLQARNRLDLPSEPLATARTVELLGPHDLDRYLATELALLGEVDDAHAANAEAADQLEVAEFLWNAMAGGLGPGDGRCDLVLFALEHSLGVQSVGDPSELVGDARVISTLSQKLGSEVVGFQAPEDEVFDVLRVAFVGSGRVL